MRRNAPTADVTSLGMEYAQHVYARAHIGGTRRVWTQRWAPEGAHMLSNRERYARIIPFFCNSAAICFAVTSGTSIVRPPRNVNVEVAPGLSTMDSISARFRSEP